MVLAALGGPIQSAVDTVACYRAAGAAAGHAPAQLRVALASHAYVAATSQAARDDFHPDYVRYWAGALPTPHPLASLSRREFEHATTPETMLMVGSSQEVVDKILRQRELLRHDRFLAQIDIGAQSFAKVARTIERLAAEVVPQVRAACRSTAARAQEA